MTRRAFDFYPTPSWAARLLYARLPQIHGIAEPCVGAGDLIEGRDDVLWTNDVDESRAATHHRDASTSDSWRLFAPVPWVVTNPPFNMALQILRNALDHAQEGVAFFLRISFLEPTRQRSAFLVERPPSRMLVLPRISFTRDGKTDSATCAWLVWGTSVPAGIEVVDRAERISLTRGEGRS